MTNKTPLQPIVVRFNPQTTNYQVVPNRYYWYSVVIYYPENFYRVFVGKTWAHSYNNDVNVGEIDMEISNILKPYMYESEYSIKPEFDVNTGEFHPYWNSNQEEVSTIDANDPRKYGFGVMNYSVYLFDNSSNLALNRAVAVQTGQLTSSWDIDAPAYYHTDNFVMQNLLELEFPKGFISHYPKILTTNFGVFGMVNISDNYMLRYYEDVPDPTCPSGQLCPDITILPIYIGNQVLRWEEQEHQQGEEPTYILVNTYDHPIQLRLVMGAGMYLTGYLPFNITLYDAINSLGTDVKEAPVTFENIVGANSSHAIQNTFTTGDADEYTPTNTWIGGTSKQHEPEREGYDYSNTLCIMSPEFTWGAGATSAHPALPSQGYCIPFATFDECYSHYYLVWMTRSCVPVCYGFSGNTIFSQDFENTFMTSKYGNDVLKMQTVTNKWELKSGVIDKNTYSVMEDIYTSPYLLLYDTHKDKYTYVKCEDNSFTRKNSTKEDQRPFTFTVNLTEVHKNELLH